MSNLVQSSMLKTAVGVFGCHLKNTSIRNLCKMVEAKLEALPPVEIDEGTFKYILIKVSNKDQGSELSKKIVRGYADAQWHNNIFDKVNAKCKELGLDAECLGGGKIEHKPGEKRIKIFGVSTGYGKANHEESKNILKTKYADYNIEVSDE